MRAMYLSLILAPVLILATAGCSQKSASSGASSADAAVTFAKDIQPLTQVHCSKCHLDQQKGGLSLKSLESALRGGRDGADIVPGNAESSRLYLMVAGRGEKRMPPKGEPLTEAEIGIIRKWIDSGAQ